MCVYRNRYSSELCPASARATVTQLSCKNWVHLSISVHFYYTSYLQKWRQYVICRTGLLTDTNLPEIGTKNLSQCNVMSKVECKDTFHTGLHTLAYTFSTEIAKHTICINTQNPACDPTLSSYVLHMILTINSEKCLHLLSELRK